MRYIFTLTLFQLILVGNIFSQTFLEPVLGWEFSSFKTTESNLELGVIEEGLNLSAPVYGIALNHFVAERTYFTLQTTFSRKKFEANTTLLIPIGGVEMDSYKASLSLGRKFENLFVKGGLYVNFINHFVVFNENDTKTYSFYDPFEEYGLVASTGYNFHGCTIELFSNIGLTDGKNSEYNINYKKFFSIGGQIGYLLPLNFEGKVKKVNCPKF